MRVIKNDVFVSGFCCGWNNERLFDRLIFLSCVFNFVLFREWFVGLFFVLCFSLLMRLGLNFIFILELLWFEVVVLIRFLFFLIIILLLLLLFLLLLWGERVFEVGLFLFWESEVIWNVGGGLFVDYVKFFWNVN